MSIPQNAARVESLKLLTVVGRVTPCALVGCRSARGGLFSFVRSCGARGATRPTERLLGSFHDFEIGHRNLELATTTFRCRCNERLHAWNERLMGWDLQRKETHRGHELIWLTEPKRQRTGAVQNLSAVCGSPLPLSDERFKEGK